MTGRVRRTHGAAFKVKVALAAIKGEKTPIKLAQQYDVHANQITARRAQLVQRCRRCLLPHPNLARSSLTCSGVRCRTRWPCNSRCRRAVSSSSSMAPAAAESDVPATTGPWLASSTA